MNNFTEYQNLLDMSYEDAVESLISKYDYAAHNYYSEISYERYMNRENKNITKKNNSRTDEGLYLHHICEDQYTNLSSQKHCRENTVLINLNKEDISVPYCAHIKDNLVYCNIVEHTILHVLISYEKGGPFGFGGLCNRLLPTLNTWYLKKNKPNKLWEMNCFNAAYLDMQECLSLIRSMAIKLHRVYGKEQFDSCFNRFGIKY